MKLDKKSAKKKIPPIITSLFKVKNIDLIHFEVMLTDIKENPPIDLYVSITPEYSRQVIKWIKGKIIYATIKSKIFTIEEKIMREKNGTRKCVRKF